MSREYNDLSHRHIHQIGHRSEAVRRKMFPVYGLTWRPGGETSSFLGRLFRPIGTALLMSQVSYQMDGQKEGIALFGIAAQVDPITAEIHYSDCKLHHDFHRTPFVGAHGAVLDPSEDRGRRGRRGNRSWTQLALEVDKCRFNVLARNYRLPVVPELPEIVFGYGAKENIKFEVTLALRRAAATGLEISWKGHGLGSLEDYAAGDLRLQAFEKLPDDQQQALLLDAWENAIIPPNVVDNPTGLWLLPQAMTTNVFGTTRIFEFFGGLVGAHVFNPARKLGATQVPNPAIEVAKEADLDLVAAIELLQKEEPDDALREALIAEQGRLSDQILALVPAYRQRLGGQLSTTVSEQDLVDALVRPDAPVVVCPAVGSQPEATQLQSMRAALKPHVSEACTDADLLQAVAAPNAALFASGLAKIQVLHRDPRAAPAEALCFAPGDLGRDRVFAELWCSPDYGADRGEAAEVPQHVAS